MSGPKHEPQNDYPPGQPGKYGEPYEMINDVEGDDDDDGDGDD